MVEGLLPQQKWTLTTTDSTKKIKAQGHDRCRHSITTEQVS